jgi:hypothetical protein
MSRLLALPVNIRLGWNGERVVRDKHSNLFCQKNNDEGKSFMRYTLVVNVLKHFLVTTAAGKVN